MNHDKETLEAADKYAKDICELSGVENDKDLPMKKDFLAGVKWERERIRERLREVRALVDKSYFAHGSDYEANAIQIIDELLGEK